MKKNYFDSFIIAFFLTIGFWVLVKDEIWPSILSILLRFIFLLLTDFFFRQHWKCFGLTYTPMVFILLLFNVLFLTSEIVLLLILRSLLMILFFFILFLKPLLFTLICE